MHVCFNSTGLRIQGHASDLHVLPRWRGCNDPVFVNGSALEFFVAPVDDPRSNPRWYHEIDVGAGGAVFASLANRPKLGNSTNCEPGGCQAGTLPCQRGSSSTFPGAPDLRGRAIPFEGGWGDELFVPFSLFPEGFRPGGPNGRGEPWPLLRGNFYRYDFPDPPNANFTNFELTAWSPTHDASFHVPARFGVLVLDL
jgi:hypothetical protein